MTKILSRGETILNKLLTAHTDFNVEIRLKRGKNAGKDFQELILWVLFWETVTGTKIK